MLEGPSELCYQYISQEKFYKMWFIVSIPNNEYVLITQIIVRKVDNKLCEGLRLLVKTDSQENLKKL